MCLLIYYPANVFPNVDALDVGADNNPDGHGWAIVSNDRSEILTGRSLNPSDAIDSFLDARMVHSDGPALFHSRIGTAGLNSLRNCHPFAVGGDERTVIAHNGILPRKAQPGKADFRSDTRRLAEIFLPKGKLGLSALSTRRGRQSLERWMGWGNKVVVLSVDPAFRKHGYILNAFMGDWHHGAWYSNDSWREPWYAKYENRGDVKPYSETLDSQAWNIGTPRLTVIGGKSAAETRSPDDCDFCEAKHTVGAVSGVCTECLMCNGCQSYVDDCLCWIPRAERSGVADSARFTDDGAEHGGAIIREAGD